MKKLLLAAIVSAMVLVPATASAHILKEDQGISVVLHMPPDDNPQAGEPAELDLSFGDDARSFRLPDCECRVVIAQNDRTVYTAIPEPPVPGATLDGIVMATFPQGGAYEVNVAGRSKTDRFQPFRVQYIVRVADPAKQPANQGPTVLIIAAGSLAILVLVAFNNIRNGGRYRRPAK